MSDIYGNWAALFVKAVTAVSNNQAFLGAAANPTFPLNVAEQTALVNQVAALTRQTNAIIRLLLGQLDDTSGT